MYAQFIVFLKLTFILFIKHEAHVQWVSDSVLDALQMVLHCKYQPSKAHEMISPHFVDWVTEQSGSFPESHSQGEERQGFVGPGSVARVSLLFQQLLN